MPVTSLQFIAAFYISKTFIDLEKAIRCLPEHLKLYVKSAKNVISASIYCGYNEILVSSDCGHLISFFRCVMFYRYSWKINSSLLSGYDNREFCVKILSHEALKHSEIASKFVDSGIRYEVCHALLNFDFDLLNIIEEYELDEYDSQNKFTSFINDEQSFNFPYVFVRTFLCQNYETVFEYLLTRGLTKKSFQRCMFGMLFSSYYNPMNRGTIIDFCTVDEIRELEPEFLEFGDETCAFSILHLIGLGDRARRIRNIAKKFYKSI